MSSVLDAGSAVYYNPEFVATYDLRTQQGLSDFWNYVLNTLGGSTSHPGLVACRWDGADDVHIIYDSDGSTHTDKIVGEGQIWIHGVVWPSEPNTWSSMTLTVLDPKDSYILMLRIFYAGSNTINYDVRRY